MKYQHVQRIFKSPFYINFRKHYCPVCGQKLKKIKVSKVVNSKSDEAKNFDFQFGETFMIGNVKFIWTEFQCENCESQYTIDEMKQIENVKPSLLWKIFLCCVSIALIVFFIISFTCCHKMEDENMNDHIAVKYIYKDATPVYVYWKNHICPACGEKMKVAYESVIVNSESPEAKNYDFEVGDTYVVGDMEFRICFFQCSKCGFQISFDKMKEIEKKK